MSRVDDIAGELQRDWLVTGAKGGSQIQCECAERIWTRKCSRKTESGGVHFLVEDFISNAAGARNCVAGVNIKDAAESYGQCFDDIGAAHRKRIAAGGGGGADLQIHRSGSGDSSLCWRNVHLGNQRLGRGEVNENKGLYAVAANVIVSRIDGDRSASIIAQEIAAAEIGIR